MLLRIRVTWNERSRGIDVLMTAMLLSIDYRLDDWEMCSWDALENTKTE